MNSVEPVQVVVYRITARQFFFTVPDHVCEECDVTVSITRKVVEKVGPLMARLTVKPWLDSLVEALLMGGWHPPVVAVNGTIVSQGAVPTPAMVEQAILSAGGALNSSTR